MTPDERRDGPARSDTSVGWFRRWGPAAVQMTVIFGASSIPDLRGLPGGVTDHTGHFIGYAILGAAWLRGFAAARWAGVDAGSAGRAWLASALYGVLDEGHQAFVPGRLPAVDDWLADALGAACALGAALLVARVRRRAGRAV